MNGPQEPGGLRHPAVVIPLTTQYYVMPHNAVAALGADLLVMGAYGHSRLREMILGGVTREILRKMSVPILMAH